jgi:hypothetical protein
MTLTGRPLYEGYPEFEKEHIQKMIAEHGKDETAIRTKMSRRGLDYIVSRWHNTN